MFQEDEDKNDEDGGGDDCISDLLRISVVHNDIRCSGFEMPCDT
jgi:hypothetical protein